MEQTANGWLVILGIISVFMIGYAVGKWNGRYNSEEKLALTVEEAIAILGHIAKSQTKIEGNFAYDRDELSAKTSKLADRLKDQKLNSAYKLYAARDQLIEAMRVRHKA